MNDSNDFYSFLSVYCVFSYKYKRWQLHQNLKMFGKLFVKKKKKKVEATVSFEVIHIYTKVASESAAKLKSTYIKITQLPYLWERNKIFIPSSKK